MHVVTKIWREFQLPRTLLVCRASFASLLQSFFPKKCPVMPSLASMKANLEAFKARKECANSPSGVLQHNSSFKRVIPPLFQPKPLLEKIQCWEFVCLISSQLHLLWHYGEHSFPSSLQVVHRMQACLPKQAADRIHHGMDLGIHCGVSANSCKWTPRLPAHHHQGGTAV